MPARGRVLSLPCAAQGIGERIAEVLVAEGFAVARYDREACTARADADGFAAIGDVTSESEVAAFADEVVRRYGRVDVVASNAGIASITPLEDMSLEAWRQVIDVNLTGLFLVTRAFGRIMLGQPNVAPGGRGSFVNIASVAGLHGVADRAMPEPCAGCSGHGSAEPIVERRPDGCP